MRKIINILILSLFFYAFVTMVSFEPNEAAKNYYIANTQTEVKSNNIVTGIYLDYRLFDSLFETSILFVATTGVIFMAKKDVDMH